ncbi:twin-arginine translocation signal domain-containing protein [Marinobacterium mangrovicola]|uniref:Secreted protein n=1 Tax=Marinobacterium mangrovicola TaxID=1476959 RepID=A0A4R1GIQ7_9GAMM|nr:twin-arginine translocation signal domain-containing protein [Marinobacterium mangrovicola]TCK06990.1 secreted protein [Marinobacterium mangrovicola]
MNNLMISRRKFLQTASMVAAAVSVLPGINAFSGVLTEDSRMTDLERQVFGKMLQIALPTDGSSLVAPSSLPVQPTLEQALLAGMAPHIRQGLRGGIGYFNEGPVEQFGGTFVELNDADASRFVDQWADSNEVPQRALAMGLKKLTVLAYWAIPDTWAPLGYDGPVSDKWNLPSLGNTPEPQA